MYEYPLACTSLILPLYWRNPNPCINGVLTPQSCILKRTAHKDKLVCAPINCLLSDSFNTVENFELQGPFPLILCDGHPHVLSNFTQAPWRDQRDLLLV